MYPNAHQIARAIAGLTRRIAPAARRGATALCAAALLAAPIGLPGSAALAQDTGAQGTGAEGSGQSTGQPPVQGQAPATGGTQFGASPPGAPEFETRQFQDWTVRCGRPGAAVPESCEMIQQRQDEQGQTVLAVAVGKVANTDNPGMLIILPLGIWLPPGVVLKVDEGEEVPARIERCERRGCQVELLLEPKVLSLLKNGREANVLFQIYDENGEPRVVGVPFSLLGFTAALNEVMAS